MAHKSCRVVKPKYNQSVEHFYAEKKWKSGLKAANLNPALSPTPLNPQ